VVIGAVGYFGTMSKYAPPETEETADSAKSHIPWAIGCHCQGMSSRLAHAKPPNVIVSFCAKSVGYNPAH
jgi:hypothetical protein